MADLTYEEKMALPLGVRLMAGWVTPEELAGFSSDDRLEAVLGKRPFAIPIDQPCELGFRCPVCLEKAVDTSTGNYDERLHWSEYNGCLWCEVCNKDYPSVLCIDLAAEPIADHMRQGVDAAIDVFLRVVSDTIKRAIVEIDKPTGDPDGS